jgi:predicted CoA-binding protein
MNMKEIMEQRTFAVLGDTLNPEKYACQIKEGLIKNGYQVYAVGKELESLNEIPGELDIIDLCIHPAKGYKLLEEYTRKAKCVVIQPGAGSGEIKSLLEKKEQPYVEGCLLVGMRTYCNAE